MTMRLVPVLGPDGVPRQVKAHSARELADLMGLHVSTVRRRASQGLWPHVSVGSQLYFTEDQTTRIIDAGLHEYPAHEHGGA